MAIKIQLLCSRPGMRRLGVEHAATAIYDEGHWTAEQLAVFRQDAAFVVQEVDDTAVIVSGDAFEQAVMGEVERRMASLSIGLQASFNDSVTAAAAERVDAAQARVRELEAELLKVPTLMDTAVGECTAEAEKKIKELQLEIASLKAKPKPTKT